jgi:hypothetical protein
MHLGSSQHAFKYVYKKYTSRSFRVFYLQNLSLLYLDVFEWFTKIIRIFAKLWMAFLEVVEVTIKILKTAEKITNLNSFWKFLLCI